MNVRGPHLLLILVCIATTASGALQMIAPGFVLGIVGGPATPGNRHFFGTIGMFMVLFGGALLHALLSARDESIVFVWAGLQKLGAAVAVAVGVRHEVFGPLALGVAGFDLLSGLLVLWYRFVAVRNA
jgi:hypothetical protein